MPINADVLRADPHHGRTRRASFVLPDEVNASQHG
jgi:hypothetical protein